MDWTQVIVRLDKARLQKLASSVGVDYANLKKAELQHAIAEKLDDTAKEQLLRTLTVPELRRVAKTLSMTVTGTRKDDVIESFLEAADDAAFEQEMLENPPAVDAWREDVVAVARSHPLFDLVPTQPVGDDEALFDELSELLARRSLERMVFVSYVCDARALVRLAGAGIDDLAEALCRDLGAGDQPRLEPMLTLVLDRNEHSLGSTDTGRRLVALAQELPDVFQIRFGPVDRRLHAKIYVFQESMEDGAFLTGYIGSSNLTSPGIGVPGTTSNIEANVRVAGELGSEDSPAALLHRWTEQLLDESYPLTLEDLEQFQADEDVRRKIRYKRDFDTAHEMRLKHLAELICRRGRFAWPLCDVNLLHEPPDHQLAPVARSSSAGTRAFLLLDEVGLGKTVEAGLILSRELRRRRARYGVFPRRALVLAPPAIHEQWREELQTKFNVDAEVFASGYVKRVERRHGLAQGDYWDLTEAQVVITSPGLVRKHIDDIRDFDVVLVDEFHRARGPATYEALSELRQSTVLQLLASGTPLQNRLSELRSTLELALPELTLPGDKTFQDLFEGPDGATALRSVLLPLASRAFRRHLIGRGPGKIPPRRVENLLYHLSTTEAETYLELRGLHEEYSKSRRSRAGWAFLTMEQMFLSSPHAFLQLASHIAGDLWAPPELDTELSETLATRDDSYKFLRQSSHYRRRLRTLGFRLREESSDVGHLSAKEQLFLRVLSNAGGKRVLVFTRFRATQQRLAALLSASKLDVPVRQLNGSTPRRERARYLTWFTTHAPLVREDRPAGVLICTDVAAEGLNLQQGCSVLINYDLPWNPQKIEQRIGRLQRWGQEEDVLVYNLQASNPLVADGWTMDTRVVEVCRQKFGLAEQSVGASEALLGIEPVVIDELLASRAITDDDLELPVRDLTELDDLFPGSLVDEHHAAIASARSRFHEYRDLVRGFWERVTNRPASLAYAQNALFGRLQNALIQGHVGIVRDAATPLDACHRLSVMAGVRVIVEVAELHDEDEASVPLERWLIEDEVVRLWGARPDQAVFDASSWLLAGGIDEVLAEKAVGIIDPDSLEFLLRHKDQLEKSDADGMPLADVLTVCPSAIRPLLEMVNDAGEDLARSKLAELHTEWEDRGVAWNGVLSELRARAETNRLRKGVVNGLDDAMVVGVEERVSFRHEVRLTQLALVLE